MPCRRSLPLDGQFSKDWVNVYDDNDSGVRLGIMMKMMMMMMMNVMILYQLMYRLPGVVLKSGTLAGGK